MKIKLILMAIVIVTPLILTTCTAPAQPDSKVWVEVSCDEFSKNHHINQAIEVKVGETFTVNLCSNPSTGFRWSEDAQISASAILRQEDHKFVGHESEPPPPPGTPGQEVWTFNALEQGSCEIRLEYSRPWEGGEKGEWACTINVIVK